VTLYHAAECLNRLWIHPPTNNTIAFQLTICNLSSKYLQVLFALQFFISFHGSPVLCNKCEFTYWRTCCDSKDRLTAFMQEIMSMCTTSECDYITLTGRNTLALLFVFWLYWDNWCLIFRSS